MLTRTANFTEIRHLRWPCLTEFQIPQRSIENAVMYVLLSLKLWCFFYFGGCKVLTPASWSMNDYNVPDKGFTWSCWGEEREERGLLKFYNMHVHVQVCYQGLRLAISKPISFINSCWDRIILEKRHTILDYKDEWYTNCCVYFCV